MKQENSSEPISKQDAAPILELMAPDFLESFWESWKWTQDLISSAPLARAILNSSSVAGMVSDAFGYFAIPRLIEHHRVRVRSIGRAKLAVLKELFLIRFKKLTPDLHSMQIHTQEQHGIAHQQQMLPNGRKLASVTVGYTVNTMNTEVTGIYFTCPNGWNQNHWVIPIYQADDGQLGMFDPAVTPPAGAGGVEERLNVDIRIRRKRKGENG